MSGSFKHMVLLGGKSSGGRSGGRGTFRQNVRGGGAEAKSDKKPFYDPPLAVLRFMTGWIDPLSYKYDESYSTSLPGLIGRPTWQFRFGVDKETDIERVSETRTPSARESRGYDFGSGFSFLGGFATTVKFRQSISTDLVRQGDRHEKISTSWPDLGIRISRFTTLPLLKPIVNRFIEIFQPRTNFSRKLSEDRNIDGGFITSRTEEISQSPLLQINFRLLKKLTFSGTYNRSKSTRETFNSINGEPETETRSEQSSLAFSTGYSFSAPGGISIPLFGKLKFKSDVKIDINVRMNNSHSETAKPGEPFVTSADKSDFSVQPVISYTFSRQVKGGLSGRWQDSEDNYSNRRSHARELTIWAEMRF
jgi:hypothetical protein